MTLKDFKPGQEVYSLIREINIAIKYRIEECVVISVRRKYVTASSKEALGYPREFYLDDITDEYLLENKDWGCRYMLFPTKEALDNYIEKENLREWLNNAMSQSKVLSYSLDQLRAIKTILEEEKQCMK